MSMQILPIALRSGRRIPGNGQEMKETDGEYSDLHDQRQSSLFTKVQMQKGHNRGPKGSKRVQKSAQKGVQSRLSRVLVSEWKIKNQQLNHWLFLPTDARFHQRGICRKTVQDQKTFI